MHMKDFFIEERCTQSWDKMPKTPNGTYCSQCSMEVYDFTNKSPEEIRAMLYRFKDKQLCTRMSVEQETQLNTDFQLWKHSTKHHMQQVTLFTFIIVFGLTFISCTEINDQEQIEQFRQEAIKVIESDSEYNANIIEITDPSNDIAAVSTHEIDIPEIIDVNVEMLSKDTVLISKECFANLPEREYILGGAVISTVHYAEYLHDVVPEKDKQYDEKGREIPTEYEAIAFPNPTSGPSHLQLSVPEEGEINISIHNMNGQVVHDFSTHTYLPGTHELGFDLTDHPTGMYLAIIQSANFKEIVRISKL